MSGKLSPKAQVKLAALEGVNRTAQAIYSLTEQFAGARSGEDQIASTLKRRYGNFKRNLMSGGFDQLSQMAGSMELAAGRSGSQRNKARILREGIAAIKFQLDSMERVIRAEGAAEAQSDEG